MFVENILFRKIEKKKKFVEIRHNKNDKIRKFKKSHSTEFVFFSRKHGEEQNFVSERHFFVSVSHCKNRIFSSCFDFSLSQFFQSHKFVLEKSLIFWDISKRLKTNQFNKVYCRKKSKSGKKNQKI